MATTKGPIIIIIIIIIERLESYGGIEEHILLSLPPSYHHSPLSIQNEILLNNTNVLNDNNNKVWNDDNDSTLICFDFYEWKEISNFGNNSQN